MHKHMTGLIKPADLNAPGAIDALIAFHRATFGDSQMVLDPGTRLEEIQTRSAAIGTEMEELESIETPTEEQSARYSELETELVTIGDEAKELHTRIARRAAVAETLATPVAERTNGFHVPNVNVKRDPFEDLETVARAGLRSDDDLVQRAKTAVSDVRSFGTTDEHREGALRTLERNPDAAAHVLIYGSPAYRSAWGKAMRAAGSGGYASLTPEEVGALALANEFERSARADYSLTGANGGYMLPTLLDPTIIPTGTAVKNPIRRIARVEQITQNVWHGVSAGLATSYWTAEAAAMTAGNNTLASPAVTASKLTTYLPGSYEIFEDSNLQAQLPAAIAESMDYVEQSAFISGSGSGAPKGIITAISATAGSTVTATTRGSFTTASAVDVYAVANAVSPRFEDSSTWVGNKSQFNVINQMSPSGGGSLFWRNFDQAAYTKPPLLGSPVETASDMTQGMVSGTVLLILGDFSRYLIVDRIGVQVEFIPQVFNASGLPTGERALVAHKRVGGDCLDLNAFRFLKA